MNESAMRKHVCSALRKLDACAVENPIRPGTPDINFIGGWVELKWLPKWPVRGGVVKCSHFTPQQRVWLRRRSKLGGNAWLLLRVESDWLLLEGRVAADLLGHNTRDCLTDAAAMVCNGALDKIELLRILTNGKS